MIEINNEMLMVTTTVLYFIILIIEILILFKYCNVKPQEDNENDEKDD
jgi:cytochrome bd-type quinol oxidase subunit 1